VLEQTSNVVALPAPLRGPAPATAARPVTVGNQIIENIAVSRDGRWLTFDTDRNGNQDVYKVSTQGGEPDQLTSDPQDDFVNSWSPDGGMVLYHTFRNGNRDVYAVPASGGDPVPLVVTPSQDRDGVWYPDGRRLLFASDRSGRYELYAQAREGNGWGAPRRLTESGGLTPYFSPDGTRILFQHAKQMAYMMSEGGPTTDVPLSGPLAGRARQVVTGAWAEDGRHVLLVMDADSTGEQQIWSTPLEGGEPRLLVRMDDRRVGFGRGSMVARNGTLYFAVLRSESDIWTAELARR
jgi:TolB protein